MLMSTPTINLLVLAGIQPAGLCYKEVTLAHHALEPQHLLHTKLTSFSTGTQQLLKSRPAFVPSAQDLVKTSNDFNISAACWLDHACNKEWKNNITRLHKYIADTSPTLLGTKLPRSNWVRLNHLQTVCSNMYKWGLASSVACEYGKEQTAKHIINNCPIYNPPNVECSLMILDKKTKSWLPTICPDIYPGVRKQHLAQTKKNIKKCY